MECIAEKPENQTHIHDDLENTFSGQVIQNTEKSCVPKMLFAKSIRKFIMTL